MSVRYVLSCDSCGKSSDEVGNDGFTGALGFCQQCRQITNAARPQDSPLAPAACVLCGSELALKPLTRGGRTVTNPPKEGQMDCPWCDGQETLRCSGTSMVQPVFGSPAPGDIIQCRVIGRTDEGYVATVNGLSYLILSGGGENELHTWCEAERSSQVGHAQFRGTLGDSGDGLLEQLEITYQGEPCLLLDVAEITRLTAQEPLKYWDLWQFSIGIHTARRKPTAQLKVETTFWSLDLSTLFRLGSKVAEAARIWHPDQYRWLHPEQVRATIEFGDGNKESWGFPWENSQDLSERTANGPWKLTLHSTGGQVLWDFPMR